MIFFNRFLPWVCFTIVSLSFLMIIHHYASILNDMPKWQVKKEGEVSEPLFFFSFLCLFYTIPLIQVSFIGLFHKVYYCEKMAPNFEFFAIRSLVMLFQAICLSIIYFVPLCLMSRDAGAITTCLVGILYLIWLAIGALSYTNDGAIGLFWNAQDYIENLVDYYNDLLEKENKLKNYLKNTQF